MRYLVSQAYAWPFPLLLRDCNLSPGPYNVLPRRFVR